MNATTGVTNIGPTTGRCCRPSSGAGAAIATGGWAAGVESDVVTVDAATVLAFASVFDLLDSCRAAATIINGSAGSTGAFGFCAAATAVSTTVGCEATFGSEATV